jgi:hypothetical protein
VPLESRQALFQILLGICQLLLEVIKFKVIPLATPTTAASMSPVPNVSEPGMSFPPACMASTGRCLLHARSAASAAVLVASSRSNLAWTRSHAPARQFAGFAVPAASFASADAASSAAAADAARSACFASRRTRPPPKYPHTTCAIPLAPSKQLAF